MFPLISITLYSDRMRNVTNFKHFQARKGTVGSFF